MIRVRLFHIVSSMVLLWLLGLIAFAVLINILTDAFFRIRWDIRAGHRGSHINIGSARLYCRIFGDSGPPLLVETALGSPSAEWWRFAESLSSSYRVVTYDRAGSGWSSRSILPRTPQNIVMEAAALLDFLGISEPVIVLGHSQGGLYAQVFARMFPARIRGAVLLDPLSSMNRRFKDELPPDVYAGSGVDKFGSLKLTATLAGLKLLRPLKPLLIKSPPYYYYRDLSKEDIDFVWHAMLKPKHFRTAVAEYAAARDPANLEGLDSPAGFPNIPLRVLIHASGPMLEEIVQYGGLTWEAAERVDRLWMEILTTVASLSPRGSAAVSRAGSNYLHFGDPELVRAALREAADA